MADEGQAQQRPAGWKKDPSRRHYGRYWDGVQWTEHVISVEKVQSVDPIRQERIDARPAAEKPASERVVEPAAPGSVVRPAEGHLRPVAGSRGARVLPLRAWDGFRGWPRWAHWTASIICVLVIIGAAVGGDVGEPKSTASETTLTSPASAAAPSNAGPTAVTAAATTKCEPAGTQLSSITEGLKGGATSLRKAIAVALNPPVGTFRFVVVAEIDGGEALAGDGQVGAWGTPGPDASGLIFALDANAQRYSQWGEAATEGSPADRLRDEAASRPEVAAARACLAG